MRHAEQITNNTCKVYMSHPFTGEVQVQTVNTSADKVKKFWMELHNPCRPNIQDVFPELSNSEREFIKTGFTDQDWDNMFKEEEC